MSLKITFDDGLEKVDIKEIRELLEQDETIL